MADSSNEKMKEEILLSKRMFFAGCLGLPWLWICNALYFRLRVFGPMVMLDYYPGQTPPPSTTSTSATGENNNNEGDDNDNNNDDDDDGNNAQQAMEQELERQMEKKELEKWVKRSTRGAFIVMSAFFAWIVTFQVNKEHFGSKWFVMDETDAEVTGW